MNSKGNLRRTKDGPGFRVHHDEIGSSQSVVFFFNFNFYFYYFLNFYLFLFLYHLVLFFKKHTHRYFPVCIAVLGGRWCNAGLLPGACGL